MGMSWLIGRYTAFILVLIGAVATSLLAALRSASWLWAAVPLAVLALLGIYDLVQTRHAIRRNYPVLGNLRFFFEFIRPEIRQYFLEDDTNASPFSRAQRSIVYQRAKQALDKRPPSARRKTSTATATNGSIIRSRPRTSTTRISASSWAAPTAASPIRCRPSTSRP
jgi:glutamate synthase domain-containing protein 2